MTQCEMPFRRSAMAVDAATPPTPSEPRDQSASDTPPVPTMSSMLSRWLTVSNVVIIRICRLTVTMKSCIARLA